MTDALLAWNRKQRRDRKINGVAPKLNHGYFRIHDAGDIGWLKGYYEAWCEIAKRFPDVKFWAPTRDWPSPVIARRLSRPRPRNFVLRPSSLHYQERAPGFMAPGEQPYYGLDGFDAGSSAALLGETHTGTHAEAARAAHAAVQRAKIADFNCPAYLHGTVTCESSRCRTCWTRPKVTVNYPVHGMGGTMVRATKKKNPPPPLSVMARSYGRKRNPPGDMTDPSFAAHLMGEGYAPTDWTERQWRVFLAKQGIADHDDQTEVIASMAEWRR